MARVAIDTSVGNDAIKSGALGKVVESTMARIKPEAAYFTATGGKRCAYFVFDLKDVSDIPMMWLRGCRRPLAERAPPGRR
jgi:hypothetical protein